ncbi:MAG TPA: S1 family peptidase [Pilimelia sp.]|nr:S1 family peptidase [Pilimelia sp.]
MSRRLAAVSTAVAVLAAGAFAVPAVADAWWPDARRPAPPPDPYAPMLAAMQRDLSLSPDQAHARLARERHAVAVDRTLRARLGTRYGGAWLSPDASRLTVAVTDRGHEAQVRAQGAEPRVVRHSAAALHRLRQRLDRGAGRGPLAGWYVDVAENAVVVLAEGDEAPARVFLRRSGVAGDAVRVRPRATRPRLYGPAHGGDAFHSARGGRCSVGFAVEGGFVTAGHCGRAGTGARTAADRPLGAFASARFPGDDYAFVGTRDAAVAPRVNDHAGGTVPVRGAREAPVGASVCRSGGTTGWRCGVIEAHDATVRYAQGTVTGLTRTNVCAEPGDSGGSWISDGQAQGVTSGGTGDCRDGGVTYFQPLREALEAYGLNLRVAEPAAGAAGTGCARLPTRDAAALRADAATYRPSATYYISRAAGTHRGCVSAAADTPVNLALERWTGARWVTEARTSGQGTVQLAHRGEPGYYRWRAGTSGEAQAAEVGYAAPA